MASRVCPFWIGFLLLSPFRKFVQNPVKILSPHLLPGMTVMDFGTAMGFFSLPMARMIRPDGKVICVDIQEKMLQVLLKRAKKARLHAYIEIYQTDDPGINLAPFYNRLDFILCFAVVHEVQDKDRLFREFHQVLKTGGRVLLAEPRGHVSQKAFNETIDIAKKWDFANIMCLKIPRTRAVLLKKIG